MTDWIYVFLAISGLSLAGVAGLFIKLGSAMKQLETVSENAKKCPINDLVKQVTVLETLMNLFTRNLSLNFSDIIRSHDELERDELIDKLNRQCITAGELHRLATLLKNDFEEMPPSTPDAMSYKIALANLMAVVELRLHEKRLRHAG